MTWFKVDDGFSDHPKVIKALASRHGKGALALWVLCGSWSSKHEQDGQVPTEVARKLGGNRAEIELLLNCGLWEKTADGYAFHDWKQCNPARAQIEERRAKTKEKVSRWRERNQVTNRLAPEVTHQVTNPAPDPTRPDPTIRIEREGANAPSLPAALPPAPLALEPQPAPKAKRAPSPERAERAALRAATAALAERYGHETPPTASDKHLAAGAAKVAGLVAKGAQVRDAAERVARAAYERLQGGRSTSYGYALQDCVLGPSAAFQGPSRAGSSRCATEEELGPASRLEDFLDLSPDDPLLAGGMH